LTVLLRHSSISLYSAVNPVIRLTQIALYAPPGIGLAFGSSEGDAIEGKALEPVEFRGGGNIKGTAPPAAGKWSDLIDGEAGRGQRAPGRPDRG
jgi:hypothetical protein